MESNQSRAPITPLEQYRLEKLVELGQKNGESTLQFRKKDMIRYTGMAEPEYRYFHKYGLLRGQEVEGSSLHWWSVFDIRILRELLWLKRQERLDYEDLRERAVLLEREAQTPEDPKE